jgi:hypothetical protein
MGGRGGQVAKAATPPAPGGGDLAMVLRCLVPPSPRTSLRSLDDAETKREPRGREEAAIDIVFFFRPDEEIIFIRRFCLRV